jgi:hypothetical protein
MRKLNRQAERTSPLCAPSIVRDSCESFTGHPSSTVSQAEVQEMLSASVSSMDDLWARIGLNRSSVACEALCSAVVSALEAENAAPPASDVGCFVTAGVTTCDIDLRPSTVAAVAKNEGDLPTFHDLKHEEYEESAAPEPDEVEYVYPVILRSLAHFFRIYPALLVDVSITDPSSAEVGVANQEALQRVNQKAVAFISTALRKFNAKQTGSMEVRWFGRNDSTTRTAVLKILNSNRAMQSNVQIVYPGRECDKNTYAYVYPKAPRCSSSSQYPCARNNKGQFVFYICRLVLDSRESVQIETMTHEGSHHSVAFTDDLAYGRSTCQNLAKSSSARAVRNADNFCYFVQDVGR